MRIAYFTDTPPGIGGAERNLADMALASLDAGHEVTILAPQAAVVDYMQERVPGATTTQAGSDSYHDAPGAARRAAALAAQVAVLRSEFRRVRPGLVHVNNGGFPGSDLCRIAPLAARLAGVPARVISVHSLPWSRDYLSHPAVQSAADRLVWRNVDAVICPSQAVLDGLIETRGMPAALGRLLHYGIAEPAATPGAAATLRRRLAPGDELLVGMVSSRPDPEKGYGVFIEALAGVPEARGVLVGPDPGVDFISRVDELGLRNRLALVGSQHPVAPYYEAMDVLVVPSTAYECMPLVILEAMAARRPAVGSRLSGIPEAIADGETGRTFPPGDVEALSAILRDAVCSRAEWRRMGSEARQRWELLFTWPKMRSTLLAIYESVAPGSATPSINRGGGTSPADTSSPTDAGTARRPGSVGSGARQA